MHGRFPFWSSKPGLRAFSPNDRRPETIPLTKSEKTVKNKTLYYYMKQKTSSHNSVEKALRVLSAFSVEQPTWGVRELSAHLGFSPATVQRILQALKRFAFVDQEKDTRQYRLGNVYFRFTGILQSTTALGRSAPFYMKRLLSCTQETVHLNVIDGTDRLCIDAVESPQFLKAVMPIGSRSPLYAGASSKCLLAFSAEEFIEPYLEKVRPVPVTRHTFTRSDALREEIHKIKQQGYASSLGEQTPGLGSVSAPIFNHKGIGLASLSLAVPEVRFKNKRHLALCIKELLLTAEAFSEELGFNPFTL